MAKRPEKPVYAFLRCRNSLVRVMLHEGDGVANGQRVKVEIKQWRNLDRLRAYWATLQGCVDATGCAPSKEALDAYVRPAVKFVDYIRLSNGFLVGVPRHKTQGSAKNRRWSPSSIRSKKSGARVWVCQRAPDKGMAA